MKRLLILVCALAFAAAASAAPRTDGMRQAVADVRTAIDAAERQALESQSLEELNAAAREQVVRELGLTREQRKRFDPLYDAYRRALAAAVKAEKDDAREGDEAAQRRRLITRLDNIAATAEVKRDYVERFAEVLTAEQIRRLYNAEGQIATSIKRATTERHNGREVIRIKGKGRQVTQDWGAAGDYTGIAASSYFKITVSPSARTITVTADELLIDHIALDRTDGVLRFRRDAEIRAENADISVKVTVPLSTALRSLSAGSYGSIDCPTTLKGESVEVSVSSYGRVKAELAPSNRAVVKIGSYGKFEGSVTCDECEYRLSSYGSATGAVVCRKHGSVSIGSYARFSDPVKAPTLGVQVASGASMNGALECEQLRLSVSSYGKVDGAIRALDAEVSIASSASMRSDLKSHTLALALSSYAKFAGSADCRELRLTVQSGATFDAKLAARSFEATVSGYGKVRMQGDATVEKGTVKLSSNGSFAAPALRVADYSIDARGHYSKADVWCSGTLRIDAATTAQVTYDGPCRVEATPNNVRRK